MRVLLKVIVVQFILLPSLFPAILRAQDTSVFAHLKDSLGQNVDYANYSIFNATGKHVLSSWSNENGEVFFTLPSGENYLLRISFMGALLKEHSFEIPKGLETFDLGTFELNMKPILLNDVVVEGRRISWKANKIKVNIRGSSLENIGTAIDVLRETPRVVIQGDEISVLGKGSPNIYINGRRLLNIAELSNIKSTEIKNVEVLTNPKGKYGVNTSSAIVITTSTVNRDLWGVDVTDKIGTKGKFSNKLNTIIYINLPKSSIKVGVNYDHIGKMLHREETYDYSVLNDIISNRTATELSGLNRNLNFIAEMSYRFNKRHSFSFYASLDPSTRSREELDGLFRHNSTINGENSQKLNSITQNNFLNTLLSGDYHFNTRKTQLDFSGTYFFLNQKALRNLSLDQELQNFNQKSIANNLALKGDLTQILSKVLHLFTGLEYVSTQRDGKYVAKSHYTDFFSQKQVVGYVGLQANINDRWNIQTQIGAEYIDFKYLKDGVTAKEQSKNSLNYLPKISIGYDDEDLSLEVSYDKHISKPSYNQLSSNYFMSNNYLRWDGNPSLKNSYSHIFATDITYNWANLSLSYSRVKDRFFEVCTLLEENSLIVKVSPENLPDYNEYYIGLSLNPRIKKLGVYGYMGFQMQDLKYNGIFYNKPLIAYSLRLNYTFPKDIMLRCGVVGTFKNGNYATGKTKGYSNFDIRLSKKWMKGKLITQLYATDIFNTAYENISLNTNNILRQDYSHGGTRGIFLTVQYKWGKRNKGKSQSFSKEMERLMPF